MNHLNGLGFSRWIAIVLLILTASAAHFSAAATLVPLSRDFQVRAALLTSGNNYVVLAERPTEKPGTVQRWAVFYTSNGGYSAHRQYDFTGKVRLLYDKIRTSEILVQPAQDVRNSVGFVPGRETISFQFGEDRYEFFQTNILTYGMRRYSNRAPSENVGGLWVDRDELDQIRFVQSVQILPSSNSPTLSGAVLANSYDIYRAYAFAVGGVPSVVMILRAKPGKVGSDRMFLVQNNRVDDVRELEMPKMVENVFVNFQGLDPVGNENWNGIFRDDSGKKRGISVLLQRPEIVEPTASVPAERNVVGEIVESHDIEDGIQSAPGAVADAPSIHGLLPLSSIVVTHVEQEMAVDAPPVSVVRNSNPTPPRRRTALAKTVLKNFKVHRAFYFDVLTGEPQFIIILKHKDGHFEMYGSKVLRIDPKLPKGKGNIRIATFDLERAGDFDQQGVLTREFETWAEGFGRGIDPDSAPRRGLITRVTYMAGRGFVTIGNGFSGKEGEAIAFELGADVSSQIQLADFTFSTSCEDALK